MLSAIGRLATPARCRAYGPTLCVAMILGWVATRPSTHREDEHLYVDFVAFYVGGRAIVEGDLEGLYDLDSHRVRQQRALNWHDDRLASDFINPPFVAYAFAPLAYFDYPTALALWWGLCALALIAALTLLIRGLDLPRRVGLEVLAFWPIWAGFAYGQNSAWSLLVVSAFLVLLRCGHDARAGAALGLMVFKPHLAVGLGLALLVARRFRAAFASLGVALASFGACALVLPDATRRWFEVLGEEGDEFATQTYPIWGEINALFAGRQLAGPDQPGLGLALGAALTATVLVGLVLVSRRLPAEQGPAWDRALVPVWVLALMSSAHLFEYDLALLAPAYLLWRSSTLAEREPPGASMRVRGAWALAFIACTVGPFLQLAQLRALGHAIPIVFVALVLCAWVVSTDSPGAPDRGSPGYKSDELPEPE